MRNPKSHPRPVDSHTDELPALAADADSPTGPINLAGSVTPRGIALAPTARTSAATEFVLHQFPLGHIPEAAVVPARQLNDPRSQEVFEDAVECGGDIEGDAVNSSTIIGWLESLAVPTELVSIGVETNDAWCLLREQPDSDGPATWDVFWREHGNRYDWAQFSSEQVACFYLYGRLAWAQAARGVLGSTAQ